MFPDQAWDASLQNWQPTGSFHAALPTPVHGPADGTLVQLPCINQEWILLLMGCATQLQNPGIWGDTLADSIRDQVLSWVTQLQEMLWSAMDNPCCNVAMRLTSGCVLQFSTDGGTSWHDVTDWATNFCTCVVGCTTPTTPPNPQGATTAQQACNISGAMAVEIIQKAIQQAVSARTANLDALQYAQQLMTALSGVFPITYIAFTAFRDLYTEWLSLTITQLTNAAADETLWSQVTCAIYCAIKTDGKITAANAGTVISNICGMVYSPSLVVSALCNFVTNLGTSNLIGVQNTLGAIDDVDCTGCGCGPLCWELDFRAAPHGWFTNSPCPGNYVSGTGFVGSQCTGLCGGAPMALIINSPTASNWTSDGGAVGFINPVGLSSPSYPCDCRIDFYNASGTLLQTIPLPNTATPTLTKVTFSMPLTTWDHCQVVLINSGSIIVANEPIIAYVEFHNAAGGPLGTTACVD